MTKLKTMSTQIRSHYHEEPCDYLQGQMAATRLMEQFPLLGDGLHAWVFDLGDTVMKFCPSMRDGSKLFLEYARANPGPYVPVIHDMLVTDEFYLAEMEKLTEITKAEWKKLKSPEACASFTGRTVINPSNPYCHIMAEVGRLVPEDDECPPYPDMHRANFMRRPSDQLIVITDPLC